MRMAAKLVEAGEEPVVLKTAVVLGCGSFRMHYGQLVQRLKRPALLMLEGEEVVVEGLTVMEAVGEPKMRVVGGERLAEEGSRWFVECVREDLVPVLVAF